MHDTSMLEARVREQILDNCFNTIVCEAFLKAVPIPREDMTHELVQGLVNFATEALVDLGSYNLLKSALESSTSADFNTRAFLRCMNAICMESADTVVDRVIEENKDTSDMDEISAAVSKITMTTEEFDKFSKGAEKIASDDLGELIQQKVLDTIHEEKEAYQKDAELEREIKDALTEEMGSNDTDSGENGDATASQAGDDAEARAEEAYTLFLNSACGHHNHPTHESVFSRIHEMAFESILYSTEKNTHGLPLKSAAVITKRNTFPAFRSYQHRTAINALESVCRLAAFESIGTPDSPDGAEDSLDTNQKALLTASIIYAFFETLNTMNLYCPGLQDVMNFVNETIPVSKMVQDDQKYFVSELSNLISSAVNNIQKATSIPEVEFADKNLEAVREACEKSHAFEADMATLNSRILDARAVAKAKIDKLRNPTPSPAVETDMELMRRTRDTMKFSRTASYYGRKYNVDRIRFKIDPQGGDISRKCIAVECFDNSGNNTSRTTIVLEQAIAPDKLPKYIESAIRGSTLMNLDKPIMVTDSRSGITYAEM